MVRFVSNPLIGHYRRHAVLHRRKLSLIFYVLEFLILCTSLSKCHMSYYSVRMGSKEENAALGLIFDFDAHVNGNGRGKFRSLYLMSESNS